MGSSSGHVEPKRRIDEPAGILIDPERRCTRRERSESAGPPGSASEVRPAVNAGLTRPNPVVPPTASQSAAYGRHPGFRGGARSRLSKPILIVGTGLAFILRSMPLDEGRHEADQDGGDEKPDGEHEYRRRALSPPLSPVLRFHVFDVSRA